ncbi:hypothetical protein DL770_010997 [Monosporascus sp. CRB-9-2]|nr:hypothetical protein DL770_010997 [Monosporascus sp. CRB-9-2]
MSILKTVGLKNIADQQADPTATGVRYNAGLTILWSCVVIMGCAPSLRAVIKLELMKTISSSLSSILSKIKTSKSLSDKSGKSSGPYVDLELSTYKLGRSGGSSVPPFTATAAYEQGSLGKPAGTGEE